jgi:glycosyltransferase involved in cell wall biosynthesis
MKDKKLKVVHILEGFLGGTSTYMCTVLPQLVGKGLDVTLISSLDRSCPDARAKMSELRASGVKVHIIPMQRAINPFRDAYSFVAILRLLSRNKFDIVHTHCSKAGALGRAAGFMTGKNVRLHTPHCFAFTRCGNRFKKLLYIVLERALGRLTTRLVTVSRSQAEAAINSGIVPSHKCVTVNNALSNGQSISSATLSTGNPANKASLGLDKDAQIVSTACRLVNYKGIFRFLRAAGLSRAANAMFLIAGDGELKASAERFIRENRLSDRVRLLGHVSNMESIYAMSDVVALCSDAEAQPYLLLEAMRARCPIVATSVIGNKELISHDRTGLLVEPQPESIARAIDELLASTDKRNKYAENAYAYFCRRHALNKQISELTKIYNSYI